jgi:hypothetical protein
VRHREARVPLWLAIKLKSDHKAEIQCPSWLKADQLQRFYDTEVLPEKTGSLTDMPLFYLETASIMFKYAPDNVEDVERCRQLIKDIEEVRMEKLRRGRTWQLAQGKRDRVVVVLRLRGLSFLEANALNADLIPVLDELNRLGRAQDTITQQMASTGYRGDGGSASSVSRLAQSVTAASFRGSEGVTAPTLSRPSEVDPSSTVSAVSTYAGLGATTGTGGAAAEAVAASSRMGARLAGLGRLGMASSTSAVPVEEEAATEEDVVDEDEAT